MAGRPPKPLVEKEQKGRSKGRDSGGRPLPEEPKYSASVPKPHASLKGEGLRVWKRLAPKMAKQGVLTEADWSIFTQYCDAISLRFDLKRQMAKILRTKEPDMDAWHKLFRAYNANEKLLTKVSTELGLSPSSRSKVTKSPGYLKPKGAADPMGKFKREKLRGIDGGRK